MTNGMIDQQSSPETLFRVTLHATPHDSSLTRMMHSLPSQESSDVWSIGIIRNFTGPYHTICLIRHLPGDMDRDVVKNSVD